MIRNCVGIKVVKPVCRSSKNVALIRAFGVDSCFCAKVVLQVGTLEVDSVGRTVGGMTGSRAAGFLVCIHVEVVMADMGPHWRR